MTVPIVRQRAKRPKTRTGCRTCKARHLKCSEERPACLCCIRSGRKCEGYDVPKRKAERLPLLAQRRLSPLVRAPTSIMCDMTEVERSTFDFFRLFTVHKLPGDSWALSWDLLALQMGHHAPAVLHAAVALASIHRAYPEQFALEQSNKAISHIRGHIDRLDEDCSDSDVEVVILTSLLLFCFEVWRAQDQSAGLHLKNGMRILHERLRLRDPHENADGRRFVTMRLLPRDSMDLLLQTFVRLDADLTIAIKDRSYLHPVVVEEIPEFFGSLEEAMVHFNALSNAAEDAQREMERLAKAVLEPTYNGDVTSKEFGLIAATYSRSVDLAQEPGLSARLETIKQNVIRWMNAFASIPVPTQHESAHLLAQIQISGLWFDVSLWREPDQMVTDQFEEHFDHVLSQAERYFDLHRESPSGEKVPLPLDRKPAIRRAFTFGTRLVMVLCLIAIRCRTSSLRRRCIDLFREIDLQGVFDINFIVCFVQTLMDVEEEAARRILGREDLGDFKCHEIPSEARVEDVDIATKLDTLPEFYKCSQGSLVYARYDKNGDLQTDVRIFDIVRPTRLLNS